MKKLFTFIAAMLASVSMFAQEEGEVTEPVPFVQQDGMIELSTRAYDEDKTAAAGTGDWYFQGTDMYINCDSRPWRVDEVEDWNLGLNLKNNTVYTIQLAGQKAYRIEMAGFSFGDNWCYLESYGPSASDWEFVSKLGNGQKDNTTIIETAEYPLDPCGNCKTDAPHNLNGNTAGYTFCTLDFTDEPYEGTFAVKFSGNNQERVMFRIFTSLEAIAGINNAVTEKANANNAIYNLAGQRVSDNYKGVVIKNGKKMIIK